MRPFLHRSMLDRRTSLARALAPILLAAPLFAGCGSAEKSAESPGPGDAAGGGSHAEPSADLVRIGEVKAVSLGASSAAASAAASTAPPPPDGLKNDTKTTPLAQGTPVMTGAKPKEEQERAGGGGGKVQGAVVESEGSLSEAEVRNAIVQRQASFRACYSIGEKASPSGFSGSVALRITIGPSGTVASVEVVTSTTKNSEVDSCVTDAMRQIQFPAKGGTAVVGFPIEFGR